MTDGISTSLVEPVSAPADGAIAVAHHAPATDWLRRTLWIALRAGALLVVLWIIRGGIRLRNEIWTSGDDVHFFGDIQNTLHQGEAVIRQGRRLAALAAGAPLSWPQFLSGYLHRYDTVYAMGRAQQYDLDYTPARLLIAAIWVRHLQADHPGRRDLIDADLVPLLHLNTRCELASAIAMFLLVRHWWRRKYPQPSSILQQIRSAGCPQLLGRSDLPWMLGLLAGTVLWFNPALITNAHGWPQWDVWLLPFFLAALWLASCEWWFPAGMLIAVAAMFKGQILLVVPVLVLWPVCSAKVIAALRLVLGGLFATAVMTSPWLVGGGGLWVVGIIVATIAMVVSAPRGNWIGAGIGGWLGAIAIALFIVLPWTQSGQFPPLYMVLPLTVAILATPWLVKLFTGAGVLVWIAFVATATICCASSAFGGTWSWFLVGFCFPTWHYTDLAHGLSQNVPALLQQVYEWKLYDRVFVLDLGRPGWQWDVSTKALLSSIYALTLLLCGVAAAVHARRNDPRALVALTAPWVLMYAICPQMHTRYLVWAAATGSVGWAISVELALMNLLVTALASMLMLHTLLGDHGGTRSAYPRLFMYMQEAYPGLGWMMALVGAIYLYQALLPGRRRSIPRQHTRGAEGAAQSIEKESPKSIAGFGDGTDGGFQSAEIDGLG